MEDRKNFNIRAAMGWSIASGSTGILWFILCTPQQILSIVFKNYLGASSQLLGLLVGAINLASITHLASMYFYSRFKAYKPFWIAMTLVQRLLAFPIALAALGVALGLMERNTAVWVLFISSVLSALTGNVAASGWWAWMAEIIPEESRGRFFGLRSAVTQGANILFFFLATWLLDYFDAQAFYFIAVLYALGGLTGVLDVLFHLPIPEFPASRPAADFMAPLRDRNFLRFCLSVGFFLFSVNIASPFLAPYVTDPQGVAAPNVWLGIMFVISQFLWILIVPFWGTAMDRLGKKPVVLLGGFFVLSWLFYIPLGSGNYPMMLVFAALVGGVLAPAFWEGISQMMLSLAPPHQRTSYVAWYWTAFGLMSSVGAVAGGYLYQGFEQLSLSVAGRNVEALHAVIIVSIVMVLVSLSHLARLQTSDRESVSTAVSAVLNPGIFRAYSSMGILARSSPALRVAETLRKLHGGSSRIALDEVILRLDDPDPLIREEAVRTLARIGGERGEAILLRHLKDEASPLRADAALALGKMNSIKAIPYLIQALNAMDWELQEAAAVALGGISEHESVPELLNLVRNHPSVKVQVSGAQAVSLKGAGEAAGDLLSLLHRSTHFLYRRQMAQSIGNLFGFGDRIYPLLSGKESVQAQNCMRAFRQLYENVPETRRLRAEEGFSRVIGIGNWTGAVGLLQEGEKQGELECRPHCLILRDSIYAYLEADSAAEREDLALLLCCMEGRSRKGKSTSR